MKVSPLDLRQIRFRTTFRGFDRAEVAALLAEVAEDYENALRDVDTFRQEVSKMEALLNQHREFEHDLRSVDGAAFGPEPILTQSAWFRYHNQSDVPGLYFVGAGTHPGGGVPGVLSSAKVLERVAPRPERPVPLPARDAAASKLESSSMTAAS